MLPVKLIIIRVPYRLDIKFAFYYKKYTRIQIVNTMKLSFNP